MAFPSLSRWLPRALSGACVVVGAALLLLAIGPSQAALPAETPSGTIVQLRIDGEIEPVLAQYIVDGIHDAAREHASLILITINTPGGLDTSMRAIIQAILQSPTPVVNYVYPTGSRAASAGFFILLSADVDAMSPGTDTGAASPITEIGGQTVNVDETLRKKILNEATAYLRSYVSKRGRNADLAATAVTDAKAFTEQEAIAGKMVDLEANSIPDLLAKLNGRTITRFDGSTVQLALANPVIQPIEMTAREQFLARIVQPDVFFILLIVGVLGLYTEFTHPGLFAPGVIGGIALLLALYAMHLAAGEPDGAAPDRPCAGILCSRGEVSDARRARGRRRDLHGAWRVDAGEKPVDGHGGELQRGAGSGDSVRDNRDCADAIRPAVARVETGHGQGRTDWRGRRGHRAGSVDARRGGRSGMVRVHGELWRAAAPAGQSIPKGARVRVRKVTA